MSSSGTDGTSLTKRKRKVIRRRKNYPKRAPTAYMLFCNDLRAEEKKNPGSYATEKLGDKSKRHSAAWKALLNSKKRTSYEKKAAKLKADVQRARKKINGQKPKRPLNAYFRFKKEQGLLIDAAFADSAQGSSNTASVTEKGKIAGQMYRAFVAAAKTNPNGEEAKLLNRYTSEYKKEFKKFRVAMQKFDKKYPMEDKKRKKTPAKKQSKSKGKSASKKKGATKASIASKRPVAKKKMRKRKASADTEPKPAKKRSKVAKA